MQQNTQGRMRTLRMLAQRSLSRKKTTIVSGVALQIKGDPEEYESLKLIEKAALTLLFVAETYGDSPPLGASCEWGGLRYQVEAIRKLAPDGTAVLSRVIVSR